MMAWKNGMGAAEAKKIDFDAAVKAANERTAANERIANSFNEYLNTRRLERCERRLTKTDEDWRRLDAALEEGRKCSDNY